MMKSENEIPKFDLANQIMAGHRKSTAIKRIAPKKKDIRLKTIDARPQVTNYQPQNKDQEVQKSLKSDVLSLASDCSESQIISEIVARDIQNFRKR